MIYVNKATWNGGFEGNTVCQNGIEMEFSATPMQRGKAGVMTPEDALMMAVNISFQISVVIEMEKAGLEMAAYECKAEGESEDEGKEFHTIRLMPKVTICGAGTEEKAIAALKLAADNSPVTASLKSEIVLEPEIVTIGY
ncbi:OsmC family protein [Youngiibacter multivorans]|uniref:OsmC-like protein n=1 Tax=Youngiibacter multivorans TaxID=937251 RepID=A0ABS4G052_9CLOT|nr:OsmC family protein [Youngiibacter multivorans]MBP1917923.1 putative OsmC-like protein [Youngiibacter multivorans]